MGLSFNEEKSWKEHITVLSNVACRKCQFRKWTGKQAIALNQQSPLGAEDTLPITN